MRKKRNKYNEENEDNHDRWLVSYADFITLLFAFFVVMYALSTLNEGKYKVLSESVSEAFGKQKENNKKNSLIDLPIKEIQKRNIVKEKLIANFKNFSNEDIKIVETNDGLSININSQILFDSGQASIKDSDSESIIKSIIPIISQLNGAIIVQGHTDNIPISNSLFPSNWELSSARASSVAKILLKEGIEGRKISVVGFAEFQPLNNNDTSENRAKNRRISILIKK